MSKLEALLEIIEERKNKEIEDLKIIFGSEHQKKLKDLKAEYEKKLKDLNERFQKEREQIKKLLENTLTAIYMREKNALKSELYRMLVDAIKGSLKSADSDFKRRYLERLFKDAVEEMDEEFYLVCRKEDVDAVKSFYNGEVKTEDIEGGIILVGKESNVRVVADLDMFIDKVSQMINEIVERKAGEL
ncbi:MAG: hypothetical protein J7L34_04520 [Thermotogaceae bacterium]|nr:hypothetical protein [Thermotogaceae bacterium]